MTTLDPARVARSLNLNVEPLEDGAYVVSGGQEPHRVDTTEAPWSCDCRDAAFRAVRCKHTTAVYFDRQLAGTVRDALRSALGAA